MASWIRVNSEFSLRKRPVNGEKWMVETKSLSARLSAPKSRKIARLAWGFKMCDFLCNRKSLANDNSLCDFITWENDPDCGNSLQHLVCGQKSLTNGNPPLWRTQWNSQWMPKGLSQTTDHEKRKFPFVQHPFHMELRNGLVLVVFA